MKYVFLTLMLGVSMAGCGREDKSVNISVCACDHVHHKCTCKPEECKCPNCPEHSNKPCTGEDCHGH